VLKPGTKRALTLCPDQQKDPFPVEHQKWHDSPTEAQSSSVDSISGAFDPQSFQESAQVVVDILTEHLADLSIRGLDLQDPSVLGRAARALMTPGDPDDEKRLADIVRLYLRTGIQVHSPGYMGRQFSGVVPLAGLVDFVSSISNQPSSFYEAGQLPNVAEQIMAAELGDLIGWPPDTFAMVTTSGGSLANLTALLAARNRRYAGVWERGAWDHAPSRATRGGRPAIAAGADVHYSVSRTAGILGIGESHVIRLPLDDEGQIRPDLVRPALDDAHHRGLDVFCLVATAGTTSRGAFDPLGPLADIAQERDLWLHVDGAHGASLLVSDTLRGRVGDVRRADSLTWDAHKMMFVPAPCTLLFYRRQEDSRQAFHQDASYVFSKTPDAHSLLDSGDRNLECTKRPMIMALWVLWALRGKTFFAHKIEYLCHLTRLAHRILLDEPDFEVLHTPESNILCFRYHPAHLLDSDVHAFQQTVRERVRRRGRFFISQVDIKGVTALRVVMTNHRTTGDHFRMLLDEIRECGQEQAP
jgi:L-2,4-diaminobutyrate decarboxylase